MCRNSIQGLVFHYFTPHFSTPGKPQTLPSRCTEHVVLSSWYISKEGGWRWELHPLGAWRSADFWKLVHPEGQHPLAALGSFTCRSPLPPSWDCVLCRGDQALEVHGGAGCWHILCGSLCPGYSAGKHRILRVNGGDSIAPHQGLREYVRHLFIFLSI